MINPVNEKTFSVMKSNLLRFGCFIKQQWLTLVKTVKDET